MQGRKRDADIENGLVNAEGEGEDGTNGEISIDIYAKQLVECCYITQEAQPGDL